MLLPRESPEPDDIEAKNFRAQLTDANSESASLREILPRIVPLEPMQLEDYTACIKEQLWRRDIGVQPDVKPTLTAPKPHVTIGWKPEVFKSRFKKAYKSLRASISPVVGYRNVAWPILTIEIGGDGGSLGVVGLRNLHNGTVMLSNLFELKQQCGDEAAFYDKVHVIGVELTAESVQFSCYWACGNDIGDVEYYGKRGQCWSLFDETRDSLRDTRRGTYNRVDWIRPRTLEWIVSDMAALEIMNEQILRAQITPAPILASPNGVNKRRRSEDGTITSQSSRSSSHISKVSKPRLIKRRERVSFPVYVAFCEGNIYDCTSAYP